MGIVQILVTVKIAVYDFITTTRIIGHHSLSAANDAIIAALIFLCKAQEYDRTLLGDAHYDQDRQDKITN